MFYYFRDHVGPLHKIQEYQRHQILANAALITMETYVQLHVHVGETIWKPVFHIGAKMLKKKVYILGYLGGPEGSSMIGLGLSGFPAILSLIYMCMSNNETIW